MSSITEQFSAAAKSQLEAQFQIFNTFASTAVASAEKILALNLSAGRASVEQSTAAVTRLLTEPQAFFRRGLAEPPSLDQLLAYGRELAGIAAAAQSELIKSTQSGIQQVTRVTELAAAPATLTPKTAPSPALAAAVSAAVQPLSSPAPAVVAKAETPPANEPVASPPPKAVKAPAKPKPAAAPITAAEQPIEVKVAVKPSFPAPPPKPSAKLKSVAAKPKK